MTQSVVERFLSGLRPLAVGSYSLCVAAGVVKEKFGRPVFSVDAKTFASH